ncbi:hypothetical protein WA026_012904 [Henosepilachna vigintioctopunctata]|uniref:Uncharacterized protein n=1 Tax=Henosepilachna vigintioctopunctata TaxID=420089 RepID=A0AAW1TSA0_9CUCU
MWITNMPCGDKYGAFCDIPFDQLQMKNRIIYDAEKARVLGRNKFTMEFIVSITAFSWSVLELSNPYGGLTIYITSA